MLSATARQRPLENLYLWIRFSPLNSGHGSKIPPTGNPDDWVFASPRTQGRHPYWPDSLLSHVIRPAAMRAGIVKRIGWHTFRHSFSTLLMANGGNVKVVQELMRHANCRCTLEIYSQARLQAKRDAQHRVVEMIISRERKANDAPLPDELLRKLRLLRDEN